MHDHVFKHTEAHKLEDPERLGWLPPADVISRLGLLPGMKVADIGAGTGYFTFPIASERRLFRLSTCDHLRAVLIIVAVMCFAACSPQE